MKPHLRVVVAEASDVVRRGVVSVLSGGGEFTPSIVEVSGPELLRGALAAGRAEVLVVNHSFPGGVPVAQIRREWPELKLVALQTSLADGENSSLYDEAISLYEPAASILGKMARIAQTPEAVTRPEPLSARERDIVSCVVRGMTNRQIADALHLSPHTVNTHRRNISSKLDIHSTSALTIYAISNKLVKLDEAGGDK
jgi:DNA-binding NarL/FixJ family response regulator